MECIGIEECIQWIQSSDSQPGSTARPLVINADSFELYRNLITRFKADSSLTKHYASDFCPKDAVLNIPECINSIKHDGKHVLIGLSQYLLLLGENELKQYIGSILSAPCSGLSIVLMICSSGILKEKINRDVRLERRICFLTGKKSSLPKIQLINDNGGERKVDAHGLQALLKLLENMPENLEKIRFHTNLTGLLNFSQFIVIQDKGCFTELCSIDNSLASYAKQEYGTEKQWISLYKMMNNGRSFENILNDKGISLTDKNSIIESLSQKGKLHAWLAWLYLKINMKSQSRYLQLALKHSEKAEYIEKNIYECILDIDHTDPNFQSLFQERNKIIACMEKNDSAVQKYCNRASIKEKNKPYYLSFESEREQKDLMECLKIYSYSEKELHDIFKTSFPALDDYFSSFEFNEYNTKLSEQDAWFRKELTDYFNIYRYQKLRDFIRPDFLEKVEKFSKMRPYNKLPVRCNILLHCNRDNASLCFFDALGVEYLPFIQKQCGKLEMDCEISIAHAELPSITEINKDFFAYFPEDVMKVTDLDEVKHGNQKFDFKICPLPIHIFEELNIIKNVLKNVKRKLESGIEKMFIVSDHGASRLAVLYGKINTSKIEEENKGVHSGRCVKCSENPSLPQAAYENGYAVLANYERFKGGRASMIEVHGGATLEETLVPIIILSLKKESIEYSFSNPALLYSNKKPLSITLYSSVPMITPRLCINDRFYDGVLQKDRRLADFILEDIKKKGDYFAEIIINGKKTGVSLKFKVDRKTGDNADFDI